MRGHKKEKVIAAFTNYLHNNLRPKLKEEMEQAHHSQPNFDSQTGNEQSSVSVENRQQSETKFNVEVWMQSGS